MDCLLFNKTRCRKKKLTIIPHKSFPFEGPPLEWRDIQDLLDELDRQEPRPRRARRSRQQRNNEELRVEHPQEYIEALPHNMFRNIWE